ncbi:MAG: DNA polymerase III subunit delta [Elusimicrobia bacterium]|nr:DNA polymerase III subunit delta [Elusimicrobiota bacterium]
MPQLSPDQLETELASGKLRAAYFLAGENRHRKEAAIKAIKTAAQVDDFNYCEADYADMPAGDIAAFAGTAPMLSPRRMLVIRRAEKFLAEGRRILAEYLQNPLESSVLVLESGDNKLRDDTLPKACAQAGVSATFYLLRDDEACAWLSRRARQMGLSLASGAADAMVAAAGTDTGALENELEKLSAYAAGRKTPLTSDDALAVLGFEKDENPFELGRALMAGDAKRASELVDRLLDGGEYPVMLLGRITDALQKLVRARRMLAAGLSRDSLFTELGVHRYFDRDFPQQAAAFVNDALLLQSLVKAVEADAELKSSSGSEPRALLKSLILRACHARAGRS